MLKNSKVARIMTDYESEICMVYMENGEVYRKEGIYRRGQLKSYLKSLVKEDGLKITEDSKIEISAGTMPMSGDWIKNLMG